MPGFAINATRLNQILEELGKFGETPEGMDRLAFSPADVESREYTMGLMREAGLEVPHRHRRQHHRAAGRIRQFAAPHRHGIPHRHGAAGRQVRRRTGGDGGH